MKNALDEEVLQFNIKRINALAKIIVTISILLGIMNFVTRMIKTETTSYFYGYLVVYGAIVTINLLCIYYFYRSEITSENMKTSVRIVDGYISLTMILGAVITYFDIYYHGHIMMFTLIYFLCCMLFIVSTVRLLPAIVLTATIVFMGLGRTSTTPYINSNFILFVMSILVIGLIVQVILTRAQRVSLEQRLQLTAEGLKSKHLAEQLVEANKELRQMALYDSLTGLPNRHAFYQYFEQVFIEDESKVCSVFVLDIDYFKQYNDFYGHAQGDEVLRQVAGVLEQVGYHNDFYIARWGGEEFLGLSLTTDKQVDGFCQQMIKAVEQLQIEHSYSPIGPYLTVSIGIYSATANSVESFKQLYTEADQALYAAKGNGRNGYVVCAENLIIKC